MILRRSIKKKHIKSENRIKQAQPLTVKYSFRRKRVLTNLVYRQRRLDSYAKIFIVKIKVTSDLVQIAKQTLPNDFIYLSCLA